MGGHTTASLRVAWQNTGWGYFHRTSSAAKTDCTSEQRFGPKPRWTPRRLRCRHPGAGYSASGSKRTPAHSTRGPQQAAIGHPCRVHYQQRLSWGPAQGLVWALPQALCGYLGLDRALSRNPASCCPVERARSPRHVRALPALFRTAGNGAGRFPPAPSEPKGGALAARGGGRALVPRLGAAQAPPHPRHGEKMAAAARRRWRP